MRDSGVSNLFLLMSLSTVLLLLFFRGEKEAFVFDCHIELFEIWLSQKKSFIYNVPLTMFCFCLKKKELKIIST